MSSLQDFEERCRQLETEEYCQMVESLAQADKTISDAIEGYESGLIQQLKALRTKVRSCAVSPTRRAVRDLLKEVEFAVPTSR